MNFNLFALLFLIVHVLGSQLDDGNVLRTDPDEAIPDNLIDNLTENLTDNLNDPEFVKQIFIVSISNAQLDEVKYFSEQYPYLTEKFNRDIFSGLIKCFDLFDNEGTCWSIFEILAPSFNDVSSSTTTPLILAVRRDKMVLVNALLKLESVKNFIDKVDEFDRSALMYAAKRGKYFAVKRILDISTESVNLKDFLGKTAIHYACEMNPLDIPVTTGIELPEYLTGSTIADAANKTEIIGLLMANGGEIFSDGPEYKLTAADSNIGILISNFGGKVVVDNNYDVISTLGTGLAVGQAVKLLNKTNALNQIGANVIGILLANPLMLFFNDICYYLMQAILPGVDINLTVSVDIGSGIHEFSFNLLFVILMVPVLKHFYENFVNKPSIF